MFWNKKLNNNSSEESHGKIISILNQKGGVGKTTMTFNLAHALNQSGHKVLCIDMDPQANLTCHFNQDEEDDKSIFQLLINSVRELSPLHIGLLVDEVIRNCNGIDLIPSSQSLSGFELSVAGISSARPLILKNFLKKSGLLDLYDYILIDGPPTLGLIVVNIICATDGILIPFQPDKFSKRGLIHFDEVLGQVEDMGINASPQVIGYIPNMVDGRRKNEKESLENIKNSLPQIQGNLLLEPFSNKVQFVRALSNGKSIFDYKGKDYLELQSMFMKVAKKIENTFES